jgi:predicted RNase H-like nuclease (RuvC/YqgF family)
MNISRTKHVLLVAAASLATLFGMSAAAQTGTIDQILEVSTEKTQAARESQARVDRLADETRDLLEDYKSVMKQIDGLKVYNARLQRQIDNQLRRIDEIDESIDQVTIIQRQMTPLVIRMIDGLEQFVEMDIPFNLEERRERIEFLRTNVDRSDLTVAEKFRQVLEAYNIELQYGRGFETYTSTIDLVNGERDVDFLRIGRIVLVYQSTDGGEVGVWNNETRSWESLDPSEYAVAIRKGVRIAKKQATIDLLNMPVSAPEAQ